MFGITKVISQLKELKSDVKRIDSGVHDHTTSIEYWKDECKKLEDTLELLIPNFKQIKSLNETLKQYKKRIADDDYYSSYSGLLYWGHIYKYLTKEERKFHMFRIDEITDEIKKLREVPKDAE